MKADDGDSRKTKLLKGIKAVELGNSLLWRFQPLDAAVYYREALELAQQIKDEYLLGEALFGIGSRSAVPPCL